MLTHDGSVDVPVVDVGSPLELSVEFGAVVVLDVGGSLVDVAVSLEPGVGSLVEVAPAVSLAAFSGPHAASARARVRGRRG